MQIPNVTINEVCVFTIPESHLDAGNAKSAKEALIGPVSACKKAVIDLSMVGFVDSAGLGALLSCLRKINESGGDLKLAGMQKTVRALFELVRMHKVFDIFNTREEAVASFKK